MKVLTSATPDGNRKPECEDKKRNADKSERQTPEVRGGRIHLIFSDRARGEGYGTIAIGKPGRALGHERSVTPAVEAGIRGDIGGADDH
jgi:hypothetical protein